jgi:hypothetical protein
MTLSKDNFTKQKASFLTGFLLPSNPFELLPRLQSK